MNRTLAIIAIIFIAISCKKSDSDGIAPEDKQRAAELQTFLQSNSFELKKYYSETPIDYIDTDQVVKAETELWSYVSAWLHDDEYIFNADGSVSVKQNTQTIPSSTSATITKTYKVEADKNGVGFNFIGHEYQNLAYRLVTFNDTMIKVSASWNGKTVISEYNIIQ